MKKRSRKESGFWKDLNNQRRFFDDIAKEFGVNTKESQEWSKVKHQDIIKRGGRSILHYHKNSLQFALQTVYSESFIRKKDKKYWVDTNNQRVFLENVANELGIDLSKPEQWNQIKVADIFNRGGSILLSLYNNSLHKCLATVFHNYKPPTQDNTKNWWKKMENQKEFLDHIAIKFGVDTTNPTQWQKITREILIQNGGMELLKLYKGSFVKVLKANYPHYTSGPYKDKGYWKVLANQKKFLEEVAASYGICTTNPDQWKVVKLGEIVRKSGFISNYYKGSLLKALAANYPEVDWKNTKFPQLPQRGKQGKSQSFLHSIIKELFIGKHGVVLNDIWVDYKHPELIFSQNQFNMELDIFISTVNLALEYQGMRE